MKIIKMNQFATTTLIYLYVIMNIINLTLCNSNDIKKNSNYEEEINLFPFKTNHNEEIIIDKKIYSEMLNSLNPHPINSGQIERRHRFTFGQNKEKKNLKENEEIKKLINKNIKAITVKPVTQEYNFSSDVEKGFLSLSLN